MSDGTFLAPSKKEHIKKGSPTKKKKMFFTGSLLQLLPVFAAAKPLSSLPPLSTQKDANRLHNTETGSREELFKMDVHVCDFRLGTGLTLMVGLSRGEHLGVHRHAVQADGQVSHHIQLVSVRTQL